MVLKRGLSDIVTSVLTILFTISAAVLLWQVIVPFVKTSLDSGSACLNYEREYFSFEESFDTSSGKTTFNCYGPSPSGNELLFGASVKAIPAQANLYDKVAGFRLVFSGDGISSKVFEVNNTVVNSLSGSQWIYKDTTSPMIVPKNGEVITYVFSDSLTTDKYNKLEVYPVLKTGKICKASSTAMIFNCRGGVNLKQ